MKATIIHFRGSRKHKTMNQLILSPEDSNKEKSQSLVGKEAVWTSPAGKEIKGRVTGTHGNKGAVRALFEKGLPGQCISTKVEIR